MLRTYTTPCLHTFVPFVPFVLIIAASLRLSGLSVPFKSGIKCGFKCALRAYTLSPHLVSAPCLHALSAPLRRRTLSLRFVKNCFSRRTRRSGTCTRPPSPPVNHHRPPSKLAPDTCPAATAHPFLAFLTWRTWRLGGSKTFLPMRIAPIEFSAGVYGSTVIHFERQD